MIKTEAIKGESLSEKEILLKTIANLENSLAFYRKENEKLKEELSKYKVDDKIQYIDKQSMLNNLLFENIKILQTNLFEETVKENEAAIPEIEIGRKIPTQNPSSFENSNSPSVYDNFDQIISNEIESNIPIPLDSPERTINLNNLLKNDLKIGVLEKKSKALIGNKFSDYFLLFKFTTKSPSNIFESKNFPYHDGMEYIYM